MKVFQFILIACLMSLGFADDVMDDLVDTWLSHARLMMQSAKNRQALVSGLNFNTKCGAFFTWGQCNVTADDGFMVDMSTIARYSPVTLTEQKANLAEVNLDLVYEDLQLHYPDLIVSGLVNMNYKNIQIIPSQKIPFNLKMVLDYTNGVDKCTNKFQVTPPSKLPQFKSTVVTPTGTTASLPMTLIQPVLQIFIKQVSDHIASLIQYEKVCTRLADLF